MSFFVVVIIVIDPFFVVIVIAVFFVVVIVIALLFLLLFLVVALLLLSSLLSMHFGCGGEGNGCVVVVDSFVDAAAVEEGHTIIVSIVNSNFCVPVLTLKKNVITPLRDAATASCFKQPIFSLLFTCTNK